MSAADAKLDALIAGRLELVRLAEVAAKSRPPSNVQINAWIDATSTWIGEAAAALADAQRKIAEQAAENERLARDFSVARDAHDKAVIDADALREQVRAQSKILLRWLQLTNLANREPGATVADWDKLRQESHAAIDAARQPRAEEGT